MRMNFDQFNSLTNDTRVTTAPTDHDRRALTAASCLNSDGQQTMELSNLNRNALCYNYKHRDAVKDADTLSTSDNIC